MAPQPTLDLTPENLTEVQRLLYAHLLEAEIWAFGSRTNGTAIESSDLDLVVRNPKNLDQPQDNNFWDLKKALSESNLPFLVDLLDWARIPENFRNEISKGYIVVQKGI